MLTIPATAEFHLFSHSPYTAYKRSRLCVCVVEGRATSSISL
jgi:hypothetical protein